MQQPIDSEIPLPQVSGFDSSILEYLSAHLSEESVILDEYRLLASSPDAPVRYIAQLILEDEERHHRVLSELANQFRSAATLGEHSPHVPWLTKSTDRQTLARSVRRLRKFERHDLRQLKKLRRSLRPIRGHSLDPLIVETLEMDTRKHLHYLRALGRLARKR